jgi:hypothetical protein
MQEDSKETKKTEQRLCSEIKLFDLCDLEQCTRKNGRFCTDSANLARFEAISEDEVSTTRPYMAEDLCDEDEEMGEGAYAGDIGEDEYDDEEDEWKDD